MAAHLLHKGAKILCAHGAQVSVTTSNQRVKVNGHPVATIADTFSVSGCSFQIPLGVGTKPQPCVSIRWVTAAKRARVNGQPVLLKSSQGLCQSGEQIPQGNANVASTQTRVGGT